MPTSTERTTFRNYFDTDVGESKFPFLSDSNKLSNTPGPLFPPLANLSRRLRIISSRSFLTSSALALLSPPVNALKTLELLAGLVVSLAVLASALAFSSSSRFLASSSRRFFFSSLSCRFLFSSIAA